MNPAAIQLSFEAAGLDPRSLARLPSVERAKLYEQLGLDPEQREVAEEAARRARRRQYRGAGR